MTTSAPAIVDVGTNITGNNDPLALDPRATLWGFRPIWEIPDLPGEAFLGWSLPPNKFRAFRVFQFNGWDAQGKNTLTDRLPAQQAADLRHFPFFIDFPEIAALQNDQEAVKIFRLLTNPNECTEYPYDLDTSCATCWLGFLRSIKPEAVVEADLSEKARAAFIASRNRMVDNFHAAIEDANRQIDEAVSQINNPQEGKKSYQPVDYLNIRHTHNPMPEYQTANPQAMLAKALGRELRNVLPNDQKGPGDGVTVPAEFFDEFMSMKARLEAMEAKQGFEQPAAAAEVETNGDGQSFPVSDVTYTDEQAIAHLEDGPATGKGKTKTK
jgi:hypothetical protein